MYICIDFYNLLFADIVSHLKKLKGVCAKRIFKKSMRLKTDYFHLGCILQLFVYTAKRGIMIVYLLFNLKLNIKIILFYHSIYKIITYALFSGHYVRAKCIQDAHLPLTKILNLRNL